MLTTAALDFIEDLVSSNLYSETAFTSLDIANAAKDEGHFARNNEVATWLRSNVINVAYRQGSLFNQTLIRVDSKVAGPTLAYLYHHMNTDPDSYLDRDQNPKSCHRGPVVGVLGATSQARDANASLDSIDLINQSIGKFTAQTTIIPDSFASREAARTWVRNNSGYVVYDRGPYNVDRWSVRVK